MIHIADKKFLLLYILFVLVCKNGITQTFPTVPSKTLPELAPMPVPDSSGLVSVNGTKLYFAVFNAKGKQPVLLLHGGLINSDYWSREVALLSPTNKVIVIDSRDHGRSLLSGEPLHYELMASDVLGVLDQLHSQKVSLAGWSDGGIIGMVIAMHHPERLDRLFTFGANFSHSGEKDTPPDSAQLAQGAAFMKQAIENYKRVSPTPDSFSAMRKKLFALYSKEPELDTNALKHISVPTVIAYGQNEQFYKPEHFAALARMIPHAKLIELPNVGHGGPLQDPLQFHQAIMRWLK